MHINVVLQGEHPLFITQRRSALDFIRVEFVRRKHYLHAIMYVCLHRLIIIIIFISHIFTEMSISSNPLICCEYIHHKP